MADDSQDRQLPASAKKLQRARREGQVVRSRDLGHLAVVLGASGVLMAVAPKATARLQELLAVGLRFDARTVATPDVMLDRLAMFGGLVLMIVVPLALAVGLASAAASLMTGGLVWTFKPLMPQFSRVSPLSGFGRLLSKDHLIDTLKATALAGVLGTVGGIYLKRSWPEFIAALAQPLPAGLGEVGQTLGTGLKLMILTLALFALIDWPLQRHLFMSNMKMSKQEMKDEMRESEGNPEMKGRIRNLMRQRARKRMLAAVPKADLVVMNPTHYAVALKYDEALMGAPRVVAKGVDALALRIRDLATEHEVPVLEAPPLARALYAHAEVDAEIPMALYSAVAQVLAYVYQLRSALMGQMPMPGNMPDLAIPPELDPHNFADKAAT
jgi:flagellar biosynthetic protein FlhB